MALRDRVPVYMQDNQLWTDLADAIDQVMGWRVAEYAKRLADCRNCNNFLPQNIAYAKLTGKLLDASDAVDPELSANTDSKSKFLSTWIPEEWRVKGASMLGMNFFNIYAANSSYLVDQFVKNATNYQPDRGTIVWANFVGYATNSIIKVDYLWTNDYITFVTEDQIPAGSPTIITNPLASNAYYPTSTINVTIYAQFASQFTTNDFLQLLTFAAPINLVFNDIVISFESPVVDISVGAIGQLSVSWLSTPAQPTQLAQFFIAAIGLMNISWLPKPSS